MVKTIQVSVVIPTYNRAQTLPRAIESVLSQSWQNFDLWIIDDGSTDETEPLVNSYLKNYPCLHYIKTSNHGVSHARNVGIQKSHGEWLSFLDSDDEWLKDKLKLQINLAQAHSEIKVIHGEEKWIRNGQSLNQKAKHQKYGGWIFEKCLPLCVISPSAVMIHRSVFDEIGIFDEHYTVCEDYELWLRLTLKYEVGFVETPIINKYGGHSDQLSHKYFAMDYWRVKALAKALENPSLENKLRALVVAEIGKKALILLKGYKKHNNMENFAEIEKIINSTCSILSPDTRF